MNKSSINQSKQVALKPVQIRPLSFLSSAIGAAILIYILYYWHHNMADPLPPKEQIHGFFSLAALRFKLFASGPIPYSIAWTFMFGIAYLWQIHFRKHLPLKIGNLADRDIINAAKGSDVTFVRKLNELAVKGALNGYYGSRLYKLRKRYEDKDIASVIALKNDILEVDEEDLALSFTAIIWCEAALPLLGFLGTVVGIGGALGGIQGAVQLLFAKSNGVTASLNPQVAAMFGQGFQDLAVAFDTTFLGLMGLIILGILHNHIKKQLAIHLADARQFFSDIVAGWTGDGTNPMVIAIHGLDSRLNKLEEAIRSSDYSSTVFRENIREMAERVVLEDEHFTSVKKVLFKPVVEFRKADTALIRRVNEKLSGKFGAKGWELTGLATAVTAPNIIAILIRQHDNKNHVYFFNIADATDHWISPVDSDIKRLITFNPSQSVLAQNDSGDLIAIASNGTAHSSGKSLKADDQILPMAYNKNEAALVIRNVQFAFEMQIHDLSSNGNRFSPSRLSTQANWKIWCLHGPSATLYTAGERKNARQWSLLVQTLAATDENTGKKQPTPSYSNTIDLPSSLIPKQILPLAPQELLILDIQGHLHYWEAQRMTPIKLSNPLWNADPESILRGGKNRWFAVANNRRLKMWCLRRGGFLYPYDQETEGLDISALNNPEVLLPTSDDRYLFGLAENKVIIWEFPQFTIDQA